MRFPSSPSLALSSPLLLLLPLPLLTSASPLTITTTTTPIPTSISSPSASPPLNPISWHPLSTSLPQTNHKLDLRFPHPEVVIADPALNLQPLNPTQVSPLTTLMLWQTVAPGAPAQQVQVVYSQAFEEVPDQWEAPAPGEVGMGTIQGEVGVVKTLARRAAATAMPMLEVELGRRDAVAEADAFVIHPPGDGDVRLQKKKGGKSGGSNGGDASAAAPGVALTAGPPTLALLVAVLALVVL